MATKKRKLKKAGLGRVRKAVKAAKKPKITSEEKKIIEEIEPIVEKDVEKEIEKEVKEEVKELIEEEEEDNMLKIAVSVILSTILTALFAGAIWFFNPIPLSQITLVSIVVWIIITIIVYFFQSK